MSTKTGLVKKVCEGGFGFIDVESSPQDMFFHRNEVVGKQMLEVGDAVRFDIGSNKGKPCAKNVQIQGLSGREEEWFAAVLQQDCAKLRSMAADGQDLNVLWRSKQKCQCSGGQGGYSATAVQISRRQWACGRCEGEGSVFPMTTAVHLAAQLDKLEALETLTELSADVDKQVPLAAAISSGNQGLVTALLSARANANLRESDVVGSLLFRAAGAGHAELVAMLLEAGAEPDVCCMWDNYDDYGDEVELISPESLAQMKGHKEAVCAIQDWKSQVVVSLHVLSRSPDSVELSAVNLGGTEVARAHASLSDCPGYLFDHIAKKAGIAEGKLRIAAPDMHVYGRRSIDKFRGSMTMFLGSTAEAQAAPLEEAQDCLQDSH